MDTRILNYEEIYDFLYAHPEIAFEEFQTSDYLAEQLEKLGYKVTRNIGGTGVIGEIKGSNPGPVVVLRADMDALPFKDDEGNIYYKHACGHHTHMTVSLCVAEKVKDLVKKGTLRILFQPAEETAKGALSIIESGWMDDVDIALGMHNRPPQEAKEGYLVASMRYGATYFAKLKVHGLQTHSARPHLGVNAVEAVINIVNMMNCVRLDPVAAWSAKITGIHGGMVVPNLIPDTCEATFCFRAEDNALMTKLVDSFKKICNNVCEAMGANCEIGPDEGWQPASDLDPELTAMMMEACKEVVGPDKVIAEIKTPAGEDFNYYRQQNPHIRCGFLGFSAGATHGMHAKDIEFNKHAILPAIEAMTKMVLKLIG